MNSPNSKCRNPQEEPWHLVLFVARNSSASAMAIVQLKRIAAEYLPANSLVEVIDLFEESDRADQEQILAIPTLVRKTPKPVRRVIGDLSDIGRVLTSIGFVLQHPASPLAD